MGGDFGCKITVPAVIHALGKHSHLHVIMVGRKDVLERRMRPALKKYKKRLLIHHAEEVVEMDELPSKALRYKKKSSMRLAINLVKAGAADACVSAGNTGALMVTASFVLKTLPGVGRPAIVAMIPARNKVGYVRMLDLGANVDCSAQQLQQFAVMGSIIAEAADGIEQPRVALLNIGTEEIKGNDQVKGAADLLANTPSVNYVGFAEGGDIFADVADVIVSDGFVGNVALKTMEGTAKLIRDEAKAALTRSLITKMGALFLLPVLRSIKKRMNPARYNGASLLGLTGIVIKSHGNTTPPGFLKAIERAMAEVEHNVPQMIHDRVHHLLETTDTVS